MGSHAGPAITVVIATYNRGDLLVELLRSLAAQEIPAGTFEVVVVDDGSTPPAKDALAGFVPPFEMRLLVQPNAGAARARHAGVLAAKGEIIVIVDDDMLLSPTFLAEHKEAHDRGASLVLGRIVEDAPDHGRKPLFERFHARQLALFFENFRTGKTAVRGVHVCTGNVSFRRADYLAVGGFDGSLKRSEDRELGIRLEKSGARLAFADGARSLHRSDVADLDAWMRRNYLYGIYDLKISRLHGDVEIADPWYYLFEVSPISRPLLATAVALPTLGKLLSRAAMRVSLALDGLGAERIAIAGATLVFGLEYFRGVRTEAGSLVKVGRDVATYLKKRRAARA